MTHQLERRQSDSLISQQTDLAELNRLIEWGSAIVKSGFTPLKKPEDVAVAVLVGRELGITAIAAIQNLFIVNGKVGMSVGLQNGINAKAGLVTEIIEDFVPLYGYKDAVGTVVYTERQVQDNPASFAHVTTKEEVEEAKKVGKIPIVKSLTPLDYRTTVKVSRPYIDENGQKKIRSLQRSRLLSQYRHLADKDNWKNYPADMLYARCASAIYRIIAADLFTTGAGIVYTTDELTEEGVATVLTKESPIEFEVSKVDISQLDTFGQNQPKSEQKINDIPVVEIIEEVKEDFTDSNLSNDTIVSNDDVTTTTN
jgi:hypothetical protein